MSSLTWMAFSEAERRQTLDAISNLKDRETRDELGIGVVRDAISDSLFPGTSTIMTRARYLLLLNWTYRYAEQRGISSAHAARYCRDVEKRTVAVLSAWDPNAGVIGSQAGAALLRMPSSIYWQPLREWSLRRYPGGQAAYFRSLDGYYLRKRDHIRVESEDEADETEYRNWDDELPVPAGFPAGQTLDLSPLEAEYLRARYRLRHSESLFAWLVDHCEKPIPADVSSPWELEAMGIDTAVVPRVLAERLEHAELFSLAMHGSALLYNRMLAEKVSPDSEHSARQEQYAADIEVWHAEMTAARARLETWHAGLDRFWRTVEDHAYGSGWLRQRPFIEQWLSIVMDDKRRSRLITDGGARSLVYERELGLKRGLARLAGGRALDLWSGASGVGRHRFRWHRVRVLVNDIVEGMAR